MTGIASSPDSNRNNGRNIESSSYFNSPSTRYHNRANMSFGSATGTPKEMFMSMNYNNPLEDGDIDAFEVWKIDEIRNSLREAVVELSNHSLKLASKWAAEQLAGLPTPKPQMGVNTTQYNHAQNRADSFDDVHHTTPKASPSNHGLISKEKDRNSPDYDLVLYAKSLLDLGEYERAAHVLSLNTASGTNMEKPAGKLASGASVTSMKSTGGPPLPFLSATGIYFRSYALYLAGERRKEEEVVELRDPLERCSITNKNLPQLLKELGKIYRSGTMDAFCLYIYGIVLKEVQKQSSHSSTHPSMLAQELNPASGLFTGQNQHQPTSQSILIQSVLLYPLNWSAWLDLAETCIENPVIIDEVESALSPLANHWMYHFFLVHVFIEQQQHDQALVLINKLRASGKTVDDAVVDNVERNEQKSPENGIFSQCNFLKSMTAVAHYNMRDFDNAQQHFLQLCQRDPYRLEQMDIFSNILYVKESKAELSHLAHTAVRNDKYRPETCCIVGNYYSLKGLHEKAVHYFQRALRLDRTFLSAWTLMGHEFVEMKNTAAAIEAYRRAVDINPRDYRAWYGLGQTYEILNMLLYALFYYRKATALRPYDARMWCAMGGCYLGLDRTEDAMRSYERAVSNHDREGIATQKLATLYRDEGEDEKAANCYMRHLNLRMQQQLQVSSSSLSSFGTPGGIANDKELTDDNVINLVHVDAQEAEALLYLAFYHRDNGNYETASKCCLRLLDYPGEEKEEAKALLRDIRSRTDFQKNSDDEDDMDNKKRMSLSDSMQLRTSMNDQGASFEFSP